MQYSSRHRHEGQERDDVIAARSDRDAGSQEVSPRANATLSDDGGNAAVSSVGPSRTKGEKNSWSTAVCPKAIKNYLPLVNQIVAQIARRLPANVLRDDLFSAGVFGLVDSLRRNGGDGGETFEWYARTRIRGAVVDELRAQDWLTRRARAAVTAAGEETEGRTGGLVSLDDVTPADEWTHLASTDDDPAAAVEAMDNYRALARAMEKLPERERRIVGMHYFDGVKFKDIGAELGVSEPRVSQLHARALGLLREFIDRAERTDRTQRSPVRPVRADRAVRPSRAA
jgi:RNA polymerase sigma factor for flagellar operon FliA